MLPQIVTAVQIKRRIRMIITPKINLFNGPLLARLDTSTSGKISQTMHGFLINSIAKRSSYSHASSTAREAKSRSPGEPLVELNRQLRPACMTLSQFHTLLIN